MANGLLDLLGGLGTTPPAYLEGLLGAQPVEDLRKRSIGTGIANALIGYLATPKNQNLGLGRILANTAQAGIGGAQGVYDSATADYMQAQKIEEMQRAREQRAAQQEAINQVAQSNPQLGQVLKAYPQAAAGVLEKMYAQKEAKAIGKPLSLNDLATLKEQGINLPTDAGQQYQQKPDGTIEMINTVPSGTPTGTTLDKLIAVRDRLVAANPNDPNIKLYNSAIAKETQPSAGVTVNYGAPQAGVDAQGNPVFFQPSKTGGAPQIVSGVAPLREEKPATESQAKAAAFGSQMQSASAEFDQIQKEGFTPSATTAQAQVELAGTPLRVFADPLAQRAQQSQAQWAEAYLRYKTGAAATEGEVKRNINTYFPKIGETDTKVIEQKARMRKQAEEDVLKSAKQPSTIKQTQQPARSKADILKQYGL